MICKKCGENLPNNARECFTCGAKVHREEVKPAVETAEGTPPAPKKGISVGKLFRYMYTSNTYFIMCLMVTILGLLSIITTVDEIVAGDMSEYLSDIISVVMNLLLIVPMWKMYFDSKTAVASDYIGSFKFFKIVMIIRMLSVIPTVIMVIVAGIVFSAFAGDQFFSTVASVIIMALIILAPSYLAYQFASSLERSAVSDRLLIRGLSGLKTVQLVFCVFFVLFIFVYLILTFNAIFRADRVSDVTNALIPIAEAVIFFEVYDWLRDIAKKIEQA